MHGNVLLVGDERWQRSWVAKTDFYGFVKPIECMDGLEKAIQENSVMLLWTDQTTEDDLSSGIKGEANLK